MRIESPALGSVEISDEKVLQFPAGLPGFEDCHNFVMVHQSSDKEDDKPDFFLLQCADKPEVAFSVTAADTLGVNYHFSLNDEEVDMLELKNPEDAIIAIIVRAPDDQHTSPASIGLQANFMAPLILNSSARKGIQKIINQLECDITLRAESS